MAPLKEVSLASLPPARTQCGWTWPSASGSWSQTRWTPVQSGQRSMWWERRNSSKCLRWVDSSTPLPWQTGQTLSNAESTATRMNSDRLGRWRIRSAKSAATLKVMTSSLWAISPHCGPSPPQTQFLRRRRRNCVWGGPCGVAEGLRASGGTRRIRPIRARAGRRRRARGSRQRSSPPARSVPPRCPPGSCWPPSSACRCPAA